MTVLDSLLRGLRPILQVIDDWYTNRRLGLLFEARVGPGRLLVSGIDLTGSGEANPVFRQLRRSVLGYMSGPYFHPDIDLSVADLNHLAATDAGRGV